MYLVECDLITSVAGHGSHHETAKRIFNFCAAGKVDLAASTQAFQEADLLIKQGKLKPSGQADEFFSEIIAAFQRFGIQNVDVKPADTPVSIRFRKRYGLTFNDSYYAAQSFRTGFPLLSYDRKYFEVAEIRAEKPDRLLERLDAEEKKHDRR